MAIVAPPRAVVCSRRVLAPGSFAVQKSLDEREGYASRTAASARKFDVGSVKQGDLALVAAVSSFED
ncbi:MAG: hypothetical protein ACPGVZ_01225 [Myxococcota bacterium]